MKGSARAAPVLVSVGLRNASKLAESLRRRKCHKRYEIQEIGLRRRLVVNIQGIRNSSASVRNRRVTPTEATVDDLFESGSPSYRHRLDATPPTPPQKSHPPRSNRSPICALQKAVTVWRVSSCRLAPMDDATRPIGPLAHTAGAATDLLPVAPFYPWHQALCRETGRRGCRHRRLSLKRMWL